MNFVNLWRCAYVCMLFLFSGVAHAQLVPNWTSIGPVGGSVTSLVSDPVRSSTLYAGSEANGVFMSLDGGVTWAPADSGIAAPAGRQVYALASLGNFVYAAVNGGVYVSAAGGSPQWSALPGLTAPGSQNCDFTMLMRVVDTLYVVAPCDPEVHFTSVAGLHPEWKVKSLPEGSAVTSLGELGGQLALGSFGAIFTGDLLNGNLLNTEASVDQVVLFGSIASITSNTSRWAFACTLDGSVYQGDLSTGATSVQWRALGFTSEAVPSGCNGISAVRIGLAPDRWVVLMATDSGAFVSSAFTDATAEPPNLLPGPVFPMTSHVNRTLVFGSQELLWATEYGVYATAISDLLTWQIPAVALPRNGPASVASPSTRLNNVNVKDVAGLGENLYAVVESSGRPSYADVMVSRDGGASWNPTGLTRDYFFSGAIGRVRALAADGASKVLYAGTDIGVYALRESDKTWVAVGNVFEVRALAVGAQALYVGRDASVADDEGDIHNVAGGGLVVQSLLDRPDFSFETEAMPTLPADFSVRALAVNGGFIYAAGGALRTMDSEFENAVYVARDGASTAVPPLWSKIGNGGFSSKLMPPIGQIAVSQGRVFAGGDGFLRQCLNADASWADVPGPLAASGNSETVSGLASDETMLYAGLVGHGMWSWKIGSAFSMQSISVNGDGTSTLPSLFVNQVRFLNGRIYVGTSAGIAMATPVLASGENSTPVSSGGCSIAAPGKPDPLLWLLVAAACVLAFRRRVSNEGAGRLKSLANHLAAKEGQHQ